MPEFQLPLMRESKRRYNVLVWRHDDPRDVGSPIRVYLRIHPEVEQWFSDNQVEYSVAYWRMQSIDWGRNWFYRYHVIIEDPNKAMLFKLTWATMTPSTTLGFA